MHIRVIQLSLYRNERRSSNFVQHALDLPMGKVASDVKTEKNKLQKSLKKLSTSCLHDERSLHLPKELFLQRHLGDNATFF